MGRHPSTLLMTYFNRGEKLADNSNRYGWTCRSCGIEFPKGRDNHLLNHLLSPSNRCPDLTKQDLAKIAAMQAAKGRGERPAKSTTHASRPSFELGTQAMGDDATDSQAFTGLEALAEASRQVERPLTVLQDIYQVEPRSEPKFSEEDYPNPPSWNGGPLMPDNARSHSEDPIMFKAAAALAAEFEGNIAHWGGIRPKDQGVSRVFPSNASINQPSDFQPTLQSPKDLLLQQLNQAAAFPTPIASSTPRVVNFSGTSEEPPAKVQATRSKFTEARRGQVNKVRERGACLRCKMLRKTCSPDQDPCLECGKVQNPKNWLIPCRRERLWQMCDLWSVGVYCRAARVRLDHDGPDSGLEQGGLPFAVKYIGFEEPSVSLPDALLFLKNESQSIYSNRTLQTEDIASTTVDRVLEFLSDASQDDYRSVAIRPDSWIPEVQSTLHFDPEKIAAHKRQIFYNAITLYRVTHALTSAIATFRLTSLKNDVETTQDINTSPLLNFDRKSAPSIQALGLYSVFERVANVARQSFLEDLERALVKSKPGPEVLLSSFIFLACLGRVEWFFSWFDAKQNDNTLKLTLHDLQWYVATPPRDLLKKVEEFSDLMMTLLKCRKVAHQLVPTQDGILMPIEPVDPVVKEWYASLQLRAGALQAQRDASFDVDDEASVEMKHCAKFLLAWV